MQQHRSSQLVGQQPSVGRKKVIAHVTRTVFRSLDHQRRWLSGICDVISTRDAEIEFRWITCSWDFGFDDARILKPCYQTRLDTENQRSEQRNFPNNYSNFLLECVSERNVLVRLKPQIRLLPRRRIKNDQVMLF